MRIDIITVLPEMLEGFFNCSIMSRAQKKGIAEIHIHNLRDYAFDRYRKVDDYPFGGLAGMVIATLPTILIYFLLSNQVQESLVAGGVKG